MKPEPLFAGDGISASAGLFALAGGVFVVSLFCPVVQVMDAPLYGWSAAYITAVGSVSSLWYVVVRREPIALMEIVAMFAGLIANLTLLATALFGRKVRHRHALPMLTLAINGLAAGLILPATMNIGRNTSGAIFVAYGDLQIGYWLWITSLALVALGWWNVVWNRRRMRQQAMIDLVKSGPPA